MDNILHHYTQKSNHGNETNEQDDFTFLCEKDTNISEGSIFNDSAITDFSGKVNYELNSKMLQVRDAIRKKKHQIKLQEKGISLSEEFSLINSKYAF